MLCFSASAGQSPKSGDFRPGKAGISVGSEQES